MSGRVPVPGVGRVPVFGMLGRVPTPVLGRLGCTEGRETEGRETDGDDGRALGRLMLGEGRLIEGARPPPPKLRPPPPRPPRACKSPAHNDAIAMSQAGLSDAVVIQHLQTNGFSGALTANDLITLKQQGVSDPVIQSLQGMVANPVPPTYVAREPSPSPMVIEEHYYGAPGPPGFRPFHHPRHYLRAATRRNKLRWNLGYRF